MAEHHTEAAHRIQEKFHFYLVGLAFTILGLSIQTSKFGVSIASDCFEFFGWGCLLFSGIIGLLRLEMDPVLHNRYSAMNRLEDQKYNLLELKQSGEMMVKPEGKETAEDIEDVIRQTDEAYADIETRATKDREKMIRKYQYHKYIFIAGIVSLVIARGFIPFKNILFAVSR